MIKNTDMLFSVSQAAKKIGLTRAGLYYAIQRHLIVAEKYGPFLLITDSEIAKYKNHRPAAGRKKKTGAQARENIEE